MKPMKHRTTLLAAILAFAALPASGSLLEIAEQQAARRATRAIPIEIAPLPILDEPVSGTRPTNIHSSVAGPDLARVPAVLKADRFAVGLLKWSAPIGSSGDPVIGYEVQRDSGWPINLIYKTTAPEFPFNVEMIEVSNFEFWKVRTVFASGKRSSWAISRTFPERVTTQY